LKQYNIKTNQLSWHPKQTAKKLIKQGDFRAFGAKMTYKEICLYVLAFGATKAKNSPQNVTGNARRGHFARELPPKTNIGFNFAFMEIPANCVCENALLCLFLRLAASKAETSHKKRLCQKVGKAENQGWIYALHFF
jgi:hypothetical protein